jgi:Mrp family chromosome partitioning ATPase
MEMKMDDEDGSPVGLRGYVAALGRRRLLIASVAGTALALALLGLALQTPTYKSSVQLAVPPASERSELERIVFGSADLGTQQQLMTSAAVIEFALAEQGMATSPAAVSRFARSQVKVRTVPATSVLELAVADPDPERAARLAASLVEGYVSLVEQDARKRVVKANAELDVLSEAVRGELASVEQQLAAGAGSTQSSLELQRDELQAQLREAASRRAELQSAVGLVRGAEIIHPPVVATSPTTPRWFLGVAVALVIGLALGVVLALLRDQIDDTVQQERHVRCTGAGPLLCAIPSNKHSEPVVVTQPDSRAAEGYRTLRSHMLARRAPAPSAIRGRVTAVIPVDGRSDIAQVAINLALALVSSGQCVAVVDADLRRGTASALLSSGGPHGLAQLLSGGGPVAEVLQQPYAGLSFLPAGSLSAQAREQLGGGRLEVLLDELRALADEVVVVSVALEAGSEAVDVARHADDVLVVAQPGRTRGSALRDAVEQLKDVGGRVVGTALAAPSPTGRWLGRKPRTPRAAAAGFSRRGSALDREPARTQSVPPADSP